MSRLNVSGLSTHLESRGLYFRHLIRTYVRDWRSHLGETLRWTKITRSSNTSEKPHPSLGSWKSTAFLMHDAYQMVWHTYKKPSLWRNAHLIKSSLVSTLNRQWMVESVVDCRLAWMNVMQCSASQCRYVFRSDQVIHAYRRRACRYQTIDWNVRQQQHVMIPHRMFEESRSKIQKYVVINPRARRNDTKSRHGKLSNGPSHPVII